MISPLSGISILVTAGATRERIDPVRYITNDSSGKQGYAIASALAAKGAHVTLVSGITQLAPPEHVALIAVESACEMLAACLSLLPVHVAICAAAVADFRPASVQPQKIKKRDNQDTMQLELIKNPDILAELSRYARHRPELVIGFAAETEHVTEHARQKLEWKGCDWMFANDVSQGVFGSDENQIHFMTSQGIEHWDKMSKHAVAEQLAEKIVTFFDR